MKPIKGWAMVDAEGSIVVMSSKATRGSMNLLSDAEDRKARQWRIVRIEIRELPKKRKAAK